MNIWELITTHLNNNNFSITGVSGVHCKQRDFQHFFPLAAMRIINLTLGSSEWAKDTRNPVLPVSVLYEQRHHQHFFLLATLGSSEWTGD
jgi:hypothetical protein